GIKRHVLQIWKSDGGVCFLYGMMILYPKIQKMQKNLVLVCLLNFLVAALMGLALRYALVQPIPINFRFLTHGHSHVAMLGWSYLMLYVLIVHLIPNKNPRYNRLFWLTEVAVLGMMVSFPIQGYAAISI